MVAFGDLGKLLGLGTTGDVAQQTASALGVTNPVTLKAIGTTAQSAADALPGGNDVSGPPAGVDSPATLSQLSQTSSLPGPTGGAGFSNQAFIGGFGVPGLIGAGSRLLSRPGVQGLLTGVGAGAVVDFFINEFGQQKKLVITRRMQRDVKKLFMMSGGDFNMTSELYRMATGRSITPEQVVRIITKTFKSQGPFVTKAAVRKTRSTIRKMETLCDLKDRLAPPRRAAPRRRTMGSTTKVLQVK
jgi:hypothetical protein